MTYCIVFPRLEFLLSLFILIKYYLERPSHPRFFLNMASKSGPRATGTDGTDFIHRERVAPQYRTRYALTFAMTRPNLDALNFTTELSSLWFSPYILLAIRNICVYSQYSV